MEWEKAKSYILLFFIVLNLILGGLLLNERRRYTVTPEREQAITTILRQNNIVLDTRIIRRFPPMSALYIAGYDYDVNKLTNIFFGEDASFMQEESRFGYVFTYGSARLAIEQGFISFDNPNGVNAPPANFELTQSDAQRLADTFVRAHWPRFRLDDITDVPGGLRLSYRQVHQGHIIHTNFIEIIVNEMGIVQMDMQYGQVLEWLDQRPIAAPDEVLLTFVQQMRPSFALRPNDPLIIFYMDLVYFQEEVGSTDPSARYLAVPFYRIFTSWAEDPFLVNAFTNGMV